MIANVHSFSDSAMGPVASLALHVAIGGYFIAAFLALAALLLPARAKMSAADLAGGAATLALAIFFGARFIEAGSAPLGNIFEVVALSALVLAGAYLFATRIKSMPGLGAFAFPALAVIFLVDFLFAEKFPPGAARGPEQPLLIAHVVLVILSYGVFFLAAAAAVMYLLQERQIKLHRDPSYMRSFPSLESLHKLVNTCVSVGLPLLTVGFALGFIAFSADDWAGIHRNPKILASIVLWVVLMGVYLGRVSGLLHGRRHFYGVLIGFLLVLLTFAGLGMLSSAQGKSERPAVVGGR